MIEIEIKTDDKKGLREFEKIPERVEKLIFSGMEKAVELALRASKDVYLSGKALNRRTGRLYNSIDKRVFRKGGDIQAGLGDYRNATPYGRFWELGGFRKGKYLSARAFLEPAVNDNLEKMAKTIAKEIEDAKLKDMK